MQSHRFAFIAGLHRSGTSILFKCLKDHPQISGFENTGVPEDEGQHLQSVFPPALVHGGPGRFGFVPEAHLTENSPLVSDENRRKLYSEWARHWNLDRPLLLEKSPPSLIRSRFLQAMFPNSYFIVILRHPIAVSYATQKWCDTGIRALTDHWLRCHEIFARDLLHLQNVVVVKYESFVRQPREYLNALHSFLGVASDPSARPIVPDTNDKYFQRWQAKRLEMSQNPNGRAALQNMEERLNCFGYSLHDLSLCGPPAFTELLQPCTDLRAQTTVVDPVA
jgi:hypothetical protein